MSQPLQFILWLACTVAGTVLAPVLTFFVGFYSCRLVSWVAGDPEYMGLMFVVWPLTILAIPAGFIGTGLVVDRLIKRRARPSHGVDAPRGFPVERRA